MLNGERCFVMLRPPGGGNPQTVRALNSSGTQENGEPSRGIIEQVLSQARPVIAGNIAERGDLRDRASVNVLALRCAVCVPILEGEELLGLIYVDSRQQGEDELGELAGLLQSLGDHAAVALTHARTTTALAARSRRVAELAHDIRSPLGSAISLIDELAEKANDPAMPELRGLLEKSLAMAQRMLDDKPAEIVTVDAVQLVRDTCVPLRRDAERQGRRLRCVAQGNMPVGLVPSEFVRILQNLVGNALKFAPLGTAVRCTLLESDSGGLTLTVEDEGPGFPEDILKRFGEWGAKGTSAASGFGYGLAIVRSLVADLGGELSAENRINPAGRILGANLVVRLPAALRVQHSQSA
jgi:signal transduction histidine kinase